MIGLRFLFKGGMYINVTIAPGQANEIIERWAASPIGQTSMAHGIGLDGVAWGVDLKEVLGLHTFTPEGVASIPGKRISG